MEPKTFAKILVDIDMTLLLLFQMEYYLRTEFVFLDYEGS